MPADTDAAGEAAEEEKPKRDSRFRTAKPEVEAAPEDRAKRLARLVQKKRAGRASSQGSKEFRNFEEENFEAVRQSIVSSRSSTDEYAYPTPEGSRHSSKRMSQSSERAHKFGRPSDRSSVDHGAGRYSNRVSVEREPSNRLSVESSSARSSRRLSASSSPHGSQYISPNLSSRGSRSSTPGLPHGYSARASMNSPGKPPPHGLPHGLSARAATRAESPRLPHGSSARAATRTESPAHALPRGPDGSFHRVGRRSVGHARRPSAAQLPGHIVEEKFPKENFRVNREMRDEILVYDPFLTKFWTKIASKCRENSVKIWILGFRV
jgi:hypothetical protein